MLKIISSVIPSKVEVKIGNYLPLSFKNFDIDFRNLIYWRTGNIVDSLIEIGIDPDSGSIGEISLVATGTVKRIANFPEIEEYKRKYHIKGIPLVNESLLKYNVVDEKRDLDVIITNNNLVVKFKKEVSPVKIFYFDNIEFGVDSENNLILIACSELSEQDLLNVR